MKMKSGNVFMLTLVLTQFSGSSLCSFDVDPSIQQQNVEESLEYIVNLINAVDQEANGSNNKTSDDILEPCKAFLKTYATESSSFTKCLIENARPFRFCESCVSFYKKASTVFTDMTADPACSRVLLMADRVQVVRLVNKNMENIWESSYCSDCFARVNEDPTNGTVNYTLTNQTWLFLTLFNNMTKCLNDTIQNLDPFVMNVGNSSFCDKCRSHYQALNQHFTSMLADSSSEVCMDVVDMMNYTRLMWSKKLNCSHRIGDLAPVLTITGIICALPVIFYVANRLIRPRTERTIVIQRRMKFHQTNSYGSMSDSEQTLVNSNSQNNGSVTSNQQPG